MLVLEPDLQLRILVEKLDWERAERISRATHVEGAVPVQTGPRRSLFRDLPPTLVSSSVHDLLADSADWNADTWDMIDAELPRLVRTFEILMGQIPEEFAVGVTWVGDEPETEREVSRRELVDIAARGRFGTKVRYRIPSFPGAGYRD